MQSSSIASQGVRACNSSNCGDTVSQNILAEPYKYINKNAEESTIWPALAINYGS